MKNTYDVIVIGGGTAGCAAAYTAGKSGLNTLLLEKGIHLGGSITSGLVVPVMQSGNHQINTGFYNTLIDELKQIGAQITYQGNPGWFNPELAKITLDKMMQDACVDVLFNTVPYYAEIKNRNVLSIKINKTLSVYHYSIDTYNTNSADDALSVSIGAKYFIDATGNCDFAKLINCRFLKNPDEFQPMSLRFIMSGVDVDKFGKWLLATDSDRNVTTFQYIDNIAHLSSAYTWDSGKHWALAPLFNDAVQSGELKDTDRNYFQVFTIAGMPGAVAFNCPRIVENLNPNLTQDTTRALIEGRQSILRLSEFCKRHFPGFEHAYVSNIADMLGVRVSNRLRGKYIYTINDLKTGKKFKNPAVISNYPVDIHKKGKNSSVLQQTGEYRLPIESLLSADYENLLAAGRSISADYTAQGALRVQSSCFSMGEAAAKYIKKQISPD